MKQVIVGYQQEVSEFNMECHWIFDSYIVTFSACNHSNHKQNVVNGNFDESCVNATYSTRTLTMFCMYFGVDFAALAYFKFLYKKLVG